MALGGNKVLGGVEASGELARVVGVDVLLKSGQVVVLLLLDVLREIAPKLVEGRAELGVLGSHLLELVEEVLDLLSGEVSPCMGNVRYTGEHTV